MSHAAIKQLVGAALVDRELCEGLMNGKRSEVLTEFDLAEEEREMVASCGARTARDLANTVHRWLVDEGRPSSSQVNRSAARAS